MVSAGAVSSHFFTMLHLLYSAVDCCVPVIHSLKKHNFLKVVYTDVYNKGEHGLRFSKKSSNPPQQRHNDIPPTTLNFEVPLHESLRCIVEAFLRFWFKVAAMQAVFPPLKGR